MTQNRQTLQGLMMQLQRKAMEAQQLPKKLAAKKPPTLPKPKPTRKPVQNMPQR